MGSTYNIFGRTFKSHQLSIATFLLVGGGAFLASGGGKKAAKDVKPAIEAATSDEEKFVEKYIQKMEDEMAKPTPTKH